MGPQASEDKSVCEGQRALAPEQKQSWMGGGAERGAGRRVDDRNREQEQRNGDTALRGGHQGRTKCKSQSQRTGGESEGGGKEHKKELRDSAWGWG